MWTLPRIGVKGKTCDIEGQICVEGEVPSSTQMVQIRAVQPGAERATVCSASQLAGSAGFKEKQLFFAWRVNTTCLQLAHTKQTAIHPPNCAAARNRIYCAF
jgi:hypothetical protein